MAELSQLATIRFDLFRFYWRHSEAWSVRPSILHRYHNANIVGVETELDKAYESEEGLLGYDIIDGSISVLTNWGTNAENLINPHLMPNGLIGDLAQALRIRNLLRQKFPDDPHVKKSEVWAVYCVDE